MYGMPITLVAAAAPSIYLFYLMWSLSGLGGGTIETGINVYCLDVWRGHTGGGPWMHSIHFAFSLGATIGPILAAPFLSEDGSGEELGEFQNHSQIEPNMTLAQSDVLKETKIYQLYPISGALVLVSSIGFFVMAAQDSFCKRQAVNDDTLPNKSEDSDKKDFVQKTTLKLVTFVALICVFFFLYVGAEVVMGVYLTTFAVKSLLRTTKAEGAYVNAIFWGTFTAGRFLSIFLAIYLNPLSTMILSFGLCIGKEALENIQDKKVVTLPFYFRKWRCTNPLCRALCARASDLGCSHGTWNGCHLRHRTTLVREVHCGHKQDWFSVCTLCHGGA